jgi:hypothetical protein
LTTINIRDTVLRNRKFDRRSALMATPNAIAERVARPTVSVALIGLMVLGSVAVWTVIPLAGLWVASQLSDSAVQIGTVSFLVAALGIPAAMAFTGKLLTRADALHVRVTRTAPQARPLPAWRRSLSDSGSVRPTVLETIMVISALMATIAMAVWFFAFAGSSLPT